MQHREKQIEEMVMVIATKAFEQAHLENGDDNLADIVATDLYDKGYRKSSDVAREIFEVIEEMCFDFCGNFNHLYFAELKKKYKSEDFIPAPPHTCQVEIPKYYESIINQVFPELDKRICSDCIDEDAHCCSYGVGSARVIAKDAPTADVVEVVRCKDCKYGNFLIQDGQEIVSCTNEAPPFADYFCPPMRLDDFCSYGERREE